MQAAAMMSSYSSIAAFLFLVKRLILKTVPKLVLKSATQLDSGKSVS